MENENEKASERFYLDDFKIKAVHDESDNVIEGKYNITLSYGGKEQTIEISQEDVDRLLEASEYDTVHVLGSFMGNPNMFTNTNHTTLSSLVTENMFNLMNGIDEPEKVGFKKMNLSDFSPSKDQETDKTVVTGENLESLTVDDKPVVINGSEYQGVYNVSLVYDGSNKLSNYIDQKTFDKLQTVNDYQRMKILGNIFPDVDFRLDAGEQKRVGQMILDETQAITKKAEEGNVLDSTKERSEAIGTAASRYFEEIYQEENHSQSVSRGIGM